MLGQYLEISVYAPRILESISFYESLGFRQLTTGEIWSHPYSVLTDGRVQIGLHGYEFASPSLTFVLPEVAREITELRARGIEFEFIKTGSDEFNEIGFLDPDGHMVTVLEARTFSPPSFEERDFTLCGRFLDLRLPANNGELSTAFWQRLGWEIVHESASLTRLFGCGAPIAIYEPVGRASFSIGFETANLDQCEARLAAENVPFRKTTVARDGGNGCLLQSPDGLAVHIFDAASDQL